ncbi:MAG: FtsX-like permease family protein [Halofilum sp. (in: g-proteobacteria)]
MKALRFALRAIPRDLRVREMRILAAALAVAVGALSAVGFFTDRVDGAMERQASSLLAADLMIEAEDPLAPDWAQRARALGLETAQTVTFRTVVVRGDRTELVSAKAVSPEYPLRGEARIAAQAYGDATASARPPDSGQVWLDPRLFGRLDLSVGDALPLGRKSFAVAGSLEHEPDRSGGLFDLAPRVLFPLSDLDATELISPASRVDHHLLVAGASGAVAEYRAWAEGRAGRQIEVNGVEDARPELRSALDRAGIFLGLAAVLAVLLAGAAVAVAVYSFSAREADAGALLHVFGASQGLVLGTLLLRLLLVGLLASVAGVALGWLAQSGLVALLGAWFGDSLPPASLLPALIGIAAGLVTLVGFGLVPALGIRRVPVMRVLQRGRTTPTPSVAASLIAAVMAIGLLVYQQAGNAELAFWVLLATAGMLVALGGAAWVLIRVAGRLRGRAVTGWRFGLANLARRPRASLVQLVGFGFGLLALLLLAVVRVDILEAWQQEIPAQAPNQFMLNIQPGDVAEVRARLEQAGIEPEGLYPMIRGRLLAINGKSLNPDDYDGRAERLAEREFNLTRSQTHRPENEIAAGQWWDEEAGRQERLFSVETGIAEDLGIALGDRLRFRVAGEEVNGRVSNLREVQWDSFKVNFFVIGTPATLGDAPAMWITSYYAQQGTRDVIAGLARDFPGITVLDVGAILEQVRSLITQGTRAVEYVFLFTLLAGVIVLLAAVQASRNERRVEIALLRTLGARRRRVWSILLGEFAALGALAGLIAATGAALTGWVITAEVLDLPYHFNPWLFVLGTGAGGGAIALAGLVATRRLVAERPLAVLKG